MLLSFSHVYYSYPNSGEALKDIDFNISHGEKVALLGLNGSGKSTLMMHSNGLLLPTKGKVAVNGMSTASKLVKEIRKTIGMVFQNADDQLFMPTVWEDVAFGPKNMGLDNDEIIARVKEAMEITATTHLADKSPYALSGGEKKSVSIATVISMRPEMLVMDEPTSGLDYQATKRFIDLIESLDQAILISTHDISLAKRLCNRFLVLDKGRLVYDAAESPELE